MASQQIYQIPSSKISEEYDLQSDGQVLLLLSPKTKTCLVELRQSLTICAEQTPYLTTSHVTSTPMNLKGHQSTRPLDQNLIHWNSF